MALQTRAYPALEAGHVYAMADQAKIRCDTPATWRKDHPMPPTVPLVMYDSATWEDIPDSADVVAGYVDGDFAWSRAAWARFARSYKVTITTRAPGLLEANVADVENGDFTPEQAAEWIRAKHAAGLRGATIYCNLASRDAVDAACKGLAYYQWLADWTGEAHQLFNAVAVQYVSMSPRFDLSTVYSQEWIDTLDAANRPWPWG